ncbi:helix-turn-helix domain-containing protein [Nocardiopsis sp. EMB25]|uniref:helix-turn-helix domain-containing protein n=1 Tax=Nocardiopsis sp. EMB25 TaxID=2835867 RepID=UPI0022843FDA|nr:helix-turn-helix domain-containing protein [Nocardiopsis sp. EMB25]MCY9787168.1 helix-turn-helix domain-containing protein [Nocardiopsis sp. EMB25]
MNLRRRHTNKTTDVVTDLQERIRQAQALAAVPEQKLLADPRLNPQTRARADRLQAKRLATGLEMEHRRELRAVREADRRAEKAIRASAAVDAARAATDESYTVLDLVRSRTRFSRLCLGASIVLSVGSAMGLEAAVVAHHPTAPDGIGYLAEVALTGMSTTAILWAGKLARAEALPKQGRTRTALISLIAVPLLVSIIGSTIGSGPVGAVASLGAAAFSAMAYLVATTSAAAITALVGRIDGRTRTTATEVPADNGDQEHGEPTTPLPHHTAGQALEVVGEEIAEQAADYLRDHTRSHGNPSERSHDTTRSHDRSPGRSHGDDSPDDNEANTTSDEVTPSERPSERSRSHGDDSSSERVLTAQERRRLKGIENRRRVADFLSDHPGAPTGEIAQALGLAASTVRRIRREIEEGGDVS